MRRFDLYSEKDLECIQHLSGNDTIYLYVQPSFQPKRLKAIDLQHFSGTIFVEFKKKQSFLSTIVCVEEMKNNSWIFQNVKDAKVILPKNDNLFVQYSISNDFIPIFQEEDFLKSKRNKYQVFSYQFVGTIFCTRSPKELFGKCFEKLIFRGFPNTTMYVPNTSEWQKFLNRKNVCFQNVTPVFTDAIVLIKKPEDFQKLKYIPNGFVVASLMCDLECCEIEAISLKHFIGTFSFLGNHHKITDCRLCSHEDAIGLFSSVYPASTVRFYDLTLQGVTFSHSKLCEKFGGFLGKREAVAASIHPHFMPGEISFHSCHVSSIDFPVSLENGKRKIALGYFVGYGDDAMNFDKCHGQKGRDSDGKLIHSYTGREETFLTSFCPNIDEVYGRDITRVLEKSRKL